MGILARNPHEEDEQRDDDESGEPVGEVEELDDGVVLREIDHVAIVVKDLDVAIAHYRDALGLELAEIEEVPEQKVKTAIFGHGMGRIELICPTTEDSGVAKYLQKRGEGLHHICVEVDDIEAAMAALDALRRSLPDPTHPERV